MDVWGGLLKQAARLQNVWALKSPSVWLTSTWNQMLYFLQTSEIAMRGSKAPYTVVPAVALTKKGTNPWGGKDKQHTAHRATCRNNVCPNCSHHHHHYHQGCFSPTESYKTNAVWSRSQSFSSGDENVLPSVLPPVFSSQGRRGSVCHCKGETCFSRFLGLETR